MELDDRRSMVFGEVAEQYDRRRPSYPGQLVDDLLDDTTVRVVDVGCGTGIAARLFAARGCEVLGVEPDLRMAEVARRSGIRVVVARFEEWQSSQRFDLMTCAQAWHWIDPTKGPAKAAEVLREGGRLAAFWNHYEHQPAVDDCFNTVYGRFAPELLETSVALGRLRVDDPAGDDRDAHALSATGAFTSFERRDYYRTRTYTTAEWIAELDTHGDHRLLDLDLRTQLYTDLREALQQLGDRLEVRLRTHLFTAIRTSTVSAAGSNAQNGTDTPREIGAS